MSFRSEVRDPLAPVLARAVELATVPGSSLREAGANHGADSSASPTPMSRNDGTGITVYVLLLDVDSWDAADWG